MNPILDAQKKLLPEMIELLQKRYQLLLSIKMIGPIGRRALSEYIEMTQRETRKETDILRSQGLLSIVSAGMIITEDGENVLIQLHDFVREWSGLASMEKALKSHLNIKDVIIVQGDSKFNLQVKSLLGQEAARQLEEISAHEQTIALTGGSTIASIAEHLPATLKQKNLLYVAARGGIGEDVQHQANSIVASFAEKSASKYRTLYLPDQLSEESYQSIMKEPVIVEMMKLYNDTDFVIHGIGEAIEMGVKRKSSKEELTLLSETGAVGEAFGYYFNESGKAVHRIRTVGIQLEQLEKVPNILAVAGGSMKDRAILSYLKHAPRQTVLITDEGAARGMLSKLNITK